MKINMRQFLLMLMALIIISCKQNTVKVTPVKTFNVLQQLYNDQDYFGFSDYLMAQKDELSEVDKLYFNALNDNVFNKAEISNSSIESLLKLKEISLHDSLVTKLYQIKLLNHLNLYEYDLAAKTSEKLTNSYSAYLDSLDLENLRNEFKIWNSIKDVPKQEIVRNSDVEIPLVRDHVGLYNIDVDFDDIRRNFIFDTGANFSVVVRSLVDSLNLDYMEAGFYVRAATGKKVESDVAIAKRLVIGDLVVKNAVFLVLNDEDMSFPSANFYPNGIIGFPIIEALEELRFTANNSIIVPKEPIHYGAANLALDGLMPIIKVEYNDKDLRFNFDTGARKTALYNLFYTSFKDEVESNYKLESFNAASAGGAMQFEGFKIDSIEFSVDKEKAWLKNIQLHKNEIDSKSNMHGNFGQDFIKQFDEMILSFKDASIIFKGKINE